MDIQSYFSTKSQPIATTPRRSPIQHSLFTRHGSPSSDIRASPRSSPRITKMNTRNSSDNKEQMIIDAGQKKIGATQCESCNMVYTIGDPSDEAAHSKFHQLFLTTIKFTGWKKERIVQEFPEDGGRILMVIAGDPKYVIKKVEDINQIMARELGFSDSTAEFMASYKAFLYISGDKQVIGCCVTEPVTKGYRVIASGSPTKQPLNNRLWCCGTKPERASVGISKIWVYAQMRRQGIASKLLDCVRYWFEYGSLIDKDRVAFSDPTPDGKRLATQYFGQPTFLVYKYRNNV